MRTHTILFYSNLLLEYCQTPYSNIRKSKRKYFYKKEGSLTKSVMSGFFSKAWWVVVEPFWKI